MIDASFDKLSKKAAIDGVYQYDTGQRLRLSGLPSPDELIEADDMLEGNLPALQAHYGYLGDTQTEMHLVQWDDDHGVWMASIPDKFFTRSEQVNVYVYASYGSDEAGSRNKTMYEGTFTPISRPAPNNVVTEDQLEAWENLVQEVDLVLVSADTAKQNALGEVEATRAAAQEAKEAADGAMKASNEADNAIDRLRGIEARFASMNVVAETVPAGNPATATLDGNMLTLGIPRGEAGAKGETGDTGPADITLTMSGGVLTIMPK